ncbi:hypothetical protein FEP47_05781 [Burkholderia multivorans]|nr:hypothetical protein [Burkholderia multivorans]MDR9084268.1 hypothetical protein [Burkholderia multivorans]MDR9160446.1 hypothetical protein [Burkholderia multivorans]
MAGGFDRAPVRIALAEQRECDVGQAHRTEFARIETTHAGLVDERRAARRAESRERHADAHRTHAGVGQRGREARCLDRRVGLDRLRAGIIDVFGRLRVVRTRARCAGRRERIDALRLIQAAARRGRHRHVHLHVRIAAAPNPARAGGIAAARSRRGRVVVRVVVRADARAATQADCRCRARRLRTRVRVGRLRVGTDRGHREQRRTCHLDLVAVHFTLRTRIDLPPRQPC